MTENKVFANINIFLTRVDVWWMYGGCGVEVGWMWGGCRVDVGWMWGGCRVDVGSMRLTYTFSINQRVR